MMRKVCPKCKKTDTVIKISFPAEHYKRASLYPYKENKKYDLKSFDLDIEDEWREYNDFSPDPIIECAHCRHTYDGEDFEDAWEQMVWRKQGSEGAHDQV
jgi:hypothetical protein